MKNNWKSDKTYIEIPNRLFRVGKRGYGGWSRSLEDEDRINLIKELEDKGIKCHTEDIESMFQDEVREGNERCNCKVTLNIGDISYSIQNYNVRCLKHESAVKIASFFINRGLDADIEILQGWGGSKVIKSVSTNRSIKEEKEKKDKTNQINMFGEQMNNMHFVN